MEVLLAKTKTARKPGFWGLFYIGISTGDFYPSKM